MITFDDCVEIHETVEMERWHQRELDRVFKEAYQYAFSGEDLDTPQAEARAFKLFANYLENADLSQEDIDTIMEIFEA